MNRSYPAFRPRGVDSRGAVAFCAEWLAYLGDRDVRITPPGSFFDLESSISIAWVNNQYGNVDHSYVSGLLKISAADERTPLIFFAGGFTPEAQDLATERGFGLLQYDAASARLSGLNSLGRAVRGSTE